eukprot:191360-Chlamydomonas_euryale.AAC.1
MTGGQGRGRVPHALLTSAVPKLPSGHVATWPPTLSGALKSRESGGESQSHRVWTHEGCA